jgi:hypothetical protein
VKDENGKDSVLNLVMQLSSGKPEAAMASCGYSIVQSEKGAERRTHSLGDPMKFSRLS